MLRKLKEISRDTLVYGFGQGLHGLISFLLLPIYTRYLNPTDYGYLSIFEVFRTLVDMLIGFGIASALYRYYYYSEDAGERSKVVSTGFWIMIMIAAFLLLVAAPIRNWLSFQLVESRTYGGYVMLILGTSVCFNVIAYQMYLSRVRRKPVSFLIVQVSLSLLRIGLNILFVVILQFNFRGILWGNFIASATMALIMAVAWVPRAVSFDISKFYLKKMLMFSVPILGANFVFYFQNSFDRVLITRFLNLTENGLYSFGSKIASIVFFGFITPFKTAWPPYAMSISKEADNRQTYAGILLVYSALSLFLSTSLVVFSEELVELIGHGKYDIASTIVIFIVYGNFFRGLYYLISIGTDLAEKTHLVMFAQVIGTVTSLILNFILISRVGISGAGIAFSTSNIFIFVAMFIFTQRVYSIPYKTVRFLLLFVINAAVSLLPLDSIVWKISVLILLILTSLGVVLSDRNFRWTPFPSRE